MNITPMTSASTTSTRVERRRYQPAAMTAIAASTQIHHGNHNVGEKCLTGVALVSSGGRCTAFQRPLMVCRTGPGRNIHDGSLNVPRGCTLVYRMLWVNLCCATSGSH